VVGGQLQALVVPCKLVHLQDRVKTHPATVISSCALGQEKTVGSTRHFMNESVNAAITTNYLQVETA
jgi:hypothetical protein